MKECAKPHENVFAQDEHVIRTDTGETSTSMRIDSSHLTTISLSLSSPPVEGTLIIPPEGTVRPEAHDRCGPSLERLASDSLAPSLNRTPLSIAIDAENTSMANLLLRKGADVTRQDSCGLTALHLAADKGDPILVKTLLEAGSQTDQVDFSCQTALLRACMGGYYEVVKVLLESGSDPSSVDTLGNTPLRMAVQSGNEETVALLLDYGADVDS